MADPTPDPTPVPAPQPQPQPPSGWRSSEAWLTFLVIMLGALIESGLVGEASQLGKMVTFGLMVLKVMGYQYQRTQLKMMHVATAQPANDNATPAAPRTAQAGFVEGGLLVFIAIMMTVTIVSLMWACTSAKRAASTAADDLADCTTGALAKILPVAAASAGPALNEGLTVDDATGAALAMGGDIGACFLADLGDLVKHAASGANTEHTAKLSAVAAPWANDAALERYRQQTGDRRRVKTAAGVR